jgi:hypothetical protein
MNDKRIITQKEKNYIETLYLNFNLENASDNEADNATLRYYNVLSYMTDTMFQNAVALGDGDGRTWYKFPNYRIGIMSYDKAKIANQFNCVIQYEQHHLWTLDKNLNGLDLPFDVDRKYYHIKRIDVTKIAKHNEDYTVGYGYLSPYREYSYHLGTHYLGNRKNGNVFRIYNKTKELLTDTKDHPINYKKIALISEYFGDIEDLYTYELELHRKYLKGSLGIETLEQLPLIYDAYKNIVGKIRFYLDNDKNKKLIKQNKRERVEALILTDYVDFDRVEKKKYPPSEDFAINRMISIMKHYIENTGQEHSNDNYMKIINKLMRKTIDYNLKDIVVTFEDTELSHEMDEMNTKHKLMRDNQSNELEIEAKRRFGKFVSRKNAVAEIEA